MYVCVCLAVKDVSVRSAIEDGAVTREAVTEACGAGGDCGACHGMIETMIEDHVEACRPACAPPAESSERLVPEVVLKRNSNRMINREHLALARRHR